LGNGFWMFAWRVGISECLEEKILALRRGTIQDTGLQ
jgi:hypothetical protein